MAPKLLLRRSNRSIRRWLIATVFLFPTLAVGWASSVNEIIIQERSPTTAKEVQYGDTTVYVPENSFTCQQDVYFTVDASQYRGQTLSLSWVDPYGKTREVVRERIENKAHGWIAQLRLSRGNNFVPFIEGNSSGYEEFIGTWTIEFSSEAGLIWQNNFDIIC